MLPMGKVKLQRVSLGLKQDLAGEDGELREMFTWVHEGDPRFNPNEPYDLVDESELDHDYDYAFDEDAAIERMYERSYQYSYGGE